MSDVSSMLSLGTGGTWRHHCCCLGWLQRMQGQNCFPGSLMLAVEELVAEVYLRPVRGHSQLAGG